MAKLTETADLQIVDDNLPPELCAEKSGPEKSGAEKSSPAYLQQVTPSRSIQPAFYFEPSRLDKRYFQKSCLQKSDLHKHHPYQSKSLQSPSLQRIARWMSVKGDHI